MQGSKPRKISIEKAIDNEENEAIKNIDKSLKHVVIFPGGNWKPKIWPIKFFNQLIHILNDNFSNLRFIIVGSMPEKEIYFNDIKKNLHDKFFIDLMGKSLPCTSAYMTKSNLFIGNDSGLMHLSVASNLSGIRL